MKQKNITLQNFAHGAISNYGDFSNSSYYHSARKLSNMIVTPYGFLSRRPPSLLHRRLTNLDPLKVITFNDNNNVITIECYVGYFLMYINDMVYNFANPIANTYTAEDILNLNYVENPDNISIYLLTPKKPPLNFKYRQRYELPQYNVVVSEIIMVDGPYEALNSNSTMSLTPESATGFNKNLSSSAPIFLPDDVGRYVAISYNGVWGCGKIKTYVDNKNVKIDILNSFLGTTPNTNFKMSAWCSKNGYPTFGIIFEGRLCLASSPKYPKTLWISRYETYFWYSSSTRLNTNPITESILATDSITINLTTDQNILWLNAYKNSILVGTNKGVLAIKSAVLGEWISPLNYGIFEISDDITSMAISNKQGFVFYVDSYKKTIYSMLIIQDKIISIKNITSKAQHLFTGGIKDIKFIDYPFKMLWVLLNNGELVCCSIGNNDGQNNYAWHSHKLGGNAIIHSINVGATNDKSVLICILSRNIDNIFQKNAEVIEFNDWYILLNEPVFGVHLDGQFITTMVNGENLKMSDHVGKKLSVFLQSSGVYLEKFLISNVNQAIPGNYPNQNVYWGYPYESKFVSNDLDDSELLGDYKTINKIYIKTINTNEVKYSTSATNYQSYKKNHLDNALNTQANVYQLDIQQDFARVKNLSIWQDSYSNLNISYIKINLVSV